MISDCEATLCPASSCLGVAGDSLDFDCGVAAAISPSGGGGLVFKFYASVALSQNNPTALVVSSSEGSI